MVLFGQSLSYVELIGTLFGVLGVVLTVRQKVGCFPVGLVNVVLYGVVFWNAGLYADSFLQIIYTCLLLYGWYAWTFKKGERANLLIGKLTKKATFYVFIFCIFSTLFIGFLLKRQTESTVSFIDALTTSMSIAAQWMVARKKIENWLWWIVADIIYVGLYLYKHLYLTSILFFIFIILAVQGWIRWKQELKLQPIS